MENKITALLEVLGADVTEESMEEVTLVYDSVLEYEGSEYMVLTDEEADEKVLERVEDTLWAFNPSFLADLTGLEEVVFKTLGSLYESGNEAVKAIVENTCGMEALVKDAIHYDGRGHFLASYDGEELECSVEGTDYYIYRV